MEINELRERMHQFLEVTSPDKGKEIIFGKLASSRMIDLLTIGAALDCIFEELEEELEKKEKIKENVNDETLDIITSITIRFFEGMKEEDFSDYYQEEAEREKKIILSAIEEIRRILRAGHY